MEEAKSSRGHDAAPSTDPPEPAPIDLRRAINAISDVIENRPRPLREFDQIFMKAGDMVLQSEAVARWADGKSLAFIGDGDAISICVGYLKECEIIPYGPSKITVFDFDERVVNAVKRFADKERIEGLDGVLYNCVHSYPGPTDFDCFYSNPPWGASNGGESVKVFMERGFEAVGFEGEGILVVADDPDLEWPGEVLAALQRGALDAGFAVTKMLPQLHNYHLDDNPELKSCNVQLRSFRPPGHIPASQPIDPARLKNFYGRDQEPWVRYVREKAHLAYGKAHSSEYEVERLEDTSD